MSLRQLTRVGRPFHINAVCRRHLSQSAKELKTKALLDRLVRVDHAGEFGAKRIYQGQLAVLKDTPEGPIIQVSYLQGNR